jgi:two-component system, chemotaxis family, chemotaxis protein CheY
MKALVVEDDRVSRLLLQTLLSRYGECHTAVNGKKAVEAFLAALEDGQRYDLICMDIMMPEMDGQAAVRAIRRHEAAAGFLTRSVKIIMTTALGDMASVSAAFDGMCDAYLKKPIHLARLTEEMKTLGLV